MNACRRTESFAKAQSTVVKDFGAFQEFRPVLGSSATAEGGRPDLRHFPSQIPLSGNVRTPFILPIRFSRTTFPATVAISRRKWESAEPRMMQV